MSPSPILSVWLGIAVYVTAAASAFATGTEQFRKSGDAFVRLQVDRLEVLLSGEIAVVVRIEGPAPLEVAPIPAITNSPAWRVRPASAPEIRPSADNRILWQQAFSLEPLQVKEVRLPIAPVRFRYGVAAKWQEVTWEPFAIQVTTEIATADLSELRDPADIEQVPTVPAGAVWWLWALSAVIAILGGMAVAGWFYLRGQTKPAAPLPPHQWALRELAQIEASTNGEFDRYHTVISDIVRRFLELRFGLRAPEQTTTEFLASIRPSTSLAPTHQELLKELLQQCDLVKFARVSPTPQECQAARAMAARFIEDTAAGTH